MVSDETKTTEDAAAAESQKKWQPKIIAFVCNWCTYAGADLAGTSRIPYEPYVRVIKLPCTGRIDVSFILKAFEQGADGVMVSGCHPGDCHYTAGNYHARRRFAGFRDLLEFCGFDMRRVIFSWVSAAEGKKWADLVNEVVAKIRELGPFKEYQRLIADSAAELSRTPTLRLTE